MLAYESDQHGLANSIWSIREQLQAFVLKLSGHDDADGEPAATGKLMPYDEYFATLFRIATGWLGWPPNVAWEATPAEIIEAKKGRIELLREIFGGKDDETVDALNGKIDSATRAKLDAIGNLANVQVP
ncbi:hypothetical protein [Nitrobacter sp.]|uniref:hypothetical protein n=1 Tax=Nitrobacter sp. TaxID=29420 RepID=UPI003F64BFD1